MKSIVYLVPLDGNGGVEIAARTLQKLDNENFKFSLLYIFQKRSEVFNTFKLVKSIRKVLMSNPDVLIVSLWRSALVGIFVKIFRPKIKVILFIHSEKDTHFFDFIVTRIAIFFSQELWFDSIASSKNRFRIIPKKLSSYIVSFNSRKINKFEGIKNKPNFIFWGRVSEEKGLFRALDIFQGVLKFFPEATYTIIGSQEYEFHKIKQHCIDRNIHRSIRFFDEMKFEDIMNIAKFASFYLQTSKFEGFAMSVVESMMMGLVPVVTPVGEISKYCNTKNSIIVYSNMEAIRDIIMVLRNNNSFNNLSNIATQTWKGKITYKDSFVKNCLRLL